MNNETLQAAAQRFTARLIAQGFKSTAMHAYHDSSGKPLYWRIRMTHPVKKEKWIRPIHQNKQGGFSLGEPDFPNGKPLYCLPEINQNPEESVWIVEGEWCADHLIKLGLVATTSGCARSAKTADWNSLSGREIIIWPDNDTAGLRYAQEVTSQLKALNCQVRWVDIGQLNLPAKGDCVDWLDIYPNAEKSDLTALPLIDPPIIDEISLEDNCSESQSTTPPLFTVNDKGVFYQVEEETRWVCSKLEIKALVRDKVSENWGRLLEFTDADGHLHTWAMPMEMLRGSGEELRGELLRLGLEIAPGNRARNLLIEYITTTKPQARARCVTRTGWFNHTFVLPHHAVGDTDEWVIYQSETPGGSYVSAGTLQQWQQHVAAYCAGNSRLVLAISCAFAAMLLQPAGMESGGIHLVGESSTGKTTALRVAASVFGGMDYLHRWRATTNGLEALAALRCDTLLVLDELAQVEAKDAGEIAYMLANGSGKARATKNGAVRSRYEWRLLFLSAGEVGLAQHISEAGKKAKAGQEVRLVDLPADAGVGLGIFDTLHNFATGAELSKRLIDASSQYYGSPALAFLEQITKTEYLQLLPDTIKTLCRQFLTKQIPDNSSGQVHRVCERFALIAAAGELATDLGITGWISGMADQAAANCFQAWLEYRGCDGNQERNAFLAQVQAFFEAHGASRFEDLKVISEQRIANRIGFKAKNSLNEYEYFVLPQMFRQEICKGFNPRWAAQILVEVGMIKPGTDGRPQSTHRLGCEGLRKCYHFLNTQFVK